MHLLFLSLGCFFTVFSLYSEEIPFLQRLANQDWKTELSEIDTELRRMDDEQIRLKRSMTRWNDAGSRWQFQQGMTQEAKRAFEKADMDKEQMAKNQKYIDALKNRREEILKEHPEAKPKPNANT